jgi:ADP-heptose:LPS heptosyltransferase
LIAPYDEAGEKHQSERNLDIVRYIGVDTDDLSEIMRASDAERDTARQRLASLGLRPNLPAIGIHVGAGKIKNRWPAKRFAELAEKLRGQYGAQIILFWGGKEAELAEKFCAHLRFEPIKAPPANLRELAAFFTQCNLLLCNDTGVMHIGAAVGVPLLAIFGPTDPREWKPIGSDFIALRGDGGEVENVSVEQAFEAVVSSFGAKLESRQPLATCAGV